MKMGLTWYTGLLVRFTSSAGWLLGRRSCHCGAFEPAYQSDPDGLLRTLNCCHGLGQEHAEQFGRLMNRPPTSNRLTRKYGSIITCDQRGGGLLRVVGDYPRVIFGTVKKCEIALLEVWQGN